MISLVSGFGLRVLSLAEGLSGAFVLLFVWCVCSYATTVYVQQSVLLEVKSPEDVSAIGVLHAQALKQKPW